MNGGSYCECLTDWLLTLVKSPKLRCCSQCSEPVQDHSKAHHSVLLVVCAKNSHIPHFVEAYLHNKCVDAFDVEYNRKKRNLLYPRFMLNNRDAGFGGVLYESMRGHRSIMSYCPACRAYEQEHVRFDHCSGCESVTYCDTECQLKDWPEHREFCGKRKTALANIESVSRIEEDATVNVCCVNPLHATQMRRENTNLCSNPTCDNIIAYPCMGTFYASTCKVPEQSGIKTHVTTMHFCNIVCQKYWNLSSLKKSE